MRYCCSLLLAASLAAIACAASGGLGPKAVIEEYCRLDFDGARLGIGDDSRIPSLVSWPAEPGWDHNLIVRGFAVGKPRLAGDEATITVEYEVVGRWIGEKPIELATARERLEFKLVRRGDGWVINEGQYPPHASPRAMTALLELLLKREKDETEREVLSRDLERLRSLK